MKKSVAYTNTAEAAEAGYNKRKRPKSKLVQITCALLVSCFVTIARVSPLLLCLLCAKFAAAQSRLKQEHKITNNKMSKCISAHIISCGSKFS